MHLGSVKITAIPRIPDVREGDNLGMVIGKALDDAGLALEESDILCIAHKVISKAEGNLVFLRDVKPSQEAIKLGKKLNKDIRKAYILQYATEGSRRLISHTITEEVNEESRQYHVLKNGLRV